MQYICQVKQQQKQNDMKKFTITGYNRNNNAVETITYNTNDLTQSMINYAMNTIQLFSTSPLRFEIKEI